MTMVREGVREGGVTGGERGGCDRRWEVGLKLLGGGNLALKISGR